MHKISQFPTVLSILVSGHIILGLRGAVSGNFHPDQN